MQKVLIEDHGDVAVLRLNNGVSNAINQAMLDELSTALQEVLDGYKGMVFCGGDKFFSTGFDLPELLELERSAMADYYYNFNRLVLDLYTLPMPAVCSIRGHAVAGGNVLALTCDYRFMADGRKLIGLNEVKLGVPVPYLADMMLRQITGDRQATEMLYYGEFMSSGDALKIGLVDEVLFDEEIENRAIEKACELAALPGEAFTGTKYNRIEAVQSRYEKNHKEKHEYFLDCWFSQSVQELLQKAAEKF